MSFLDVSLSLVVQSIGLGDVPAVQFQESVDHLVGVRRHLEVSHPGALQPLSCEAGETCLSVHVAVVQIEYRVVGGVIQLTHCTFYDQTVDLSMGAADLCVKVLVVCLTESCPHSLPQDFNRMLRSFPRIFTVDIKLLAHF